MDDLGVGDQDGAVAEGSAIAPQGEVARRRVFQRDLVGEAADGVEIEFLAPVQVPLGRIVRPDPRRHIAGDQADGGVDGQGKLGAIDADAL